MPYRFARKAFAITCGVMLLALASGCNAPFFESHSTGDTSGSQPNDALRAFLQKHLSPGYIADHFEFRPPSRSRSGQVTVTYVIRYSGNTAQTRTAGAATGEVFSGMARISPGGELLNYFGPLQEYRLLISRQDAEKIMRDHGCRLGTGLELPPGQEAPSGSVSIQAETVKLFVGDYFEKVGKYQQDYIPEGFYWIGGRPPKGEQGTECMVDAQTGEFKIKYGAPH